jgi:uncharacterized protein (UPF0548 family)
MFLARKPSEQMIREFLLRQTNQDLSYGEAGLSQRRAAAGYIRDHNRIQLGRGQEIFQKAVQAVRRWEMFHMGWVRLCWPETDIRVGAAVAVLVHHCWFWSLNACRIVYVIEGTGAVQRYGFAYGTLADHSECGEERFSVEWHRIDNSVWYDLLAFSRPNHRLAKVGYPFSRYLQRRFAQDSKKAMQRAVN